MQERAISRTTLSQEKSKPKWKKEKLKCLKIIFAKKDNFWKCSLWDKFLFFNFMEKSCSVLQLFILSYSINLKALTFRLLLANDVERIFEYILNRNSYGHATWPTNRYSHGKKYLRKILDLLEDSVLNPDIFTIYFTNLQMSLCFFIVRMCTKMINKKVNITL